MFSVGRGTTTEAWLAAKRAELKIDAKVVPVDGYDAGIQRLLDRSSDVFFGDRAILFEAAKRSPSARDLVVLDRMFTYEPLALTLRRGDEDLRLLVDRTLSRLYRSPDLGFLYAKWFGAPGEEAMTFFRLNALPE